MDDGSSIYAVYTGPYDTVAEACRNVPGPAAYVRELAVNPSTDTSTCPRKAASVTTQPPPTPANRGEEDLGIGGAIAEVPPCDGSYIVIVRRAVTPSSYR
jgi:hypothetical protein